MAKVSPNIYTPSKAGHAQGDPTHMLYAESMSQLPDAAPPDDDPDVGPPKATHPKIEEPRAEGYHPAPVAPHNVYAVGGMKSEDRAVPRPSTAMPTLKRSAPISGSTASGPGAGRSTSPLAMPEHSQKEPEAPCTPKSKIRRNPSPARSTAPSLARSVAPTMAPSLAPTAAPSMAPSAARSKCPSVAPSAAPSVAAGTKRDLSGRPVARPLMKPLPAPSEVEAEAECESGGDNDGDDDKGGEVSANSGKYGMVLDPETGLVSCFNFIGPCYVRS